MIKFMCLSRNLQPNQPYLPPCAPTYLAPYLLIKKDKQCVPVFGGYKECITLFKINIVQFTFKLEWNEHDL